MTQKFANAARAYLASTVSDSATTVTIDGGGSLFPAITSPEFSRAVLQDANGIEVVLITAHTAASDSFTVTRAQEGTTARSFAAGSVFGIRMTSADADTFAAKVSGPASATNSALAAFDGTTGKLIKNASLTANNVLLGNGTGAPQVVAPGTAGNVLTSNGTTWASAAPQASGLVLLSTLTANNSASVVFNLPAGYSNFLVVVGGVFPSNNGVRFICRLTINGSTQTSNYSFSQVTTSDTNPEAMVTNGSATSADIPLSSTTTTTTSTLSNVANKTLNANVYLYDALSETSMKKVFFHTSYNRDFGLSQGPVFNVTGAGSWNVNNSTNSLPVTQIVFLMSSGNISAGTLRLYGYSS